MRKTTRKSVVKRLDAVFSKYIRARDKKCVTCGAREQLQCGHLLSRVAYSTRWDEENCACQCAGCNIKHENNPAVFVMWYIKKFSQESLEKLVQKYKTVRKYPTHELEEMIKIYKQKLQDLKSEEN
jgi:hypothetical protein